MLHIIRGMFSIVTCRYILLKIDEIFPKKKFKKVLLIIGKQCDGKF